MDTTQTVMNGTVNSSDAIGVSNGIVLDSCQIRKDPDVIDQEKSMNDDKVSRNFTISIYKKCKFSIYKPLIPLKLAYYILYGAAFTITSFLLVYFKQKGVTLSELSIVFVLTPIFESLGPAICAIISDKIGRSKPVVVVSLLLIIVVVLGMLVVPRVNLPNCDPQPVNLKCHPREFGRLIAKASCDVNTDIIDLASCNVTCPENVTQYCHGQNLICEMLEGKENFDNLSLSVHVNWAYKLKSRCYYNVTSMSHKNTTYSWCNVPHKMYCRISCLMNAEDDCSEINGNRTIYLVLNLSLLILFYPLLQIIYRFMDIIGMCLVKEHNSDFGRERCFGVVGILTLSPIIGYSVDASTPEGALKNYETIFYIFMALIVLLIYVLWHLEDTIRPSGEKMWKKSLHLLKHFDHIAFLLVVSVLGTSEIYCKNYTFIFLDGLNSSGFLLGLLDSVSALYGLPFFLTSNWWVKKIGTTQILILGLLGYVAKGIGYSLLYDPRLALLIEVTTVFTLYLMLVAVNVHSHSIAPEGLTATVMTCVGIFYFGIGRSLGGFVGGQIMNTFGGRITFRVMASVCLVIAVLYAAYLYVRRTYFPERHDLNVQDETVVATYDNEEIPKEIYTLKTKS